MGSYLLNAVVNGLSGKELESQVAISKKTGKTVRRTFGAEEFALLAVVAHSQPDPGYFGRSYTIAYGDINRFVRLTHIKRSSFFNVRSFLVELGLLSYSQHERLPDITGHNIEKNYNNVYRIRVETIRALYPADAHDFWRHEILHLDDRTLARMRPEDRRALALPPHGAVQPVDSAVQPVDSAVQPVDSAVQPVDSAVQPVDSAVHPVDTNKNKQKQQTQINNNNKSVAVAEYDEKIDDLIQRIARVVAAEPSQIGRNTLKRFVNLKWLDTINDVVQEFGLKCQRNDWYSIKTAEQRIGLLMNAIKKIPLKDEDMAFAKKMADYERNREAEECLRKLRG